MKIEEIKRITTKYERKLVKVINKTENDLIYTLPIVCDYCANKSKSKVYLIKANSCFYIPFLDVFTPFGNSVEEIHYDVITRIDGFYSKITFEEEDLIQYMKQIPIMYNVSRVLI